MLFNYTIKKTKKYNSLGSDKVIGRKTSAQPINKDDLSYITNKSLKLQKI